MKIRKNELITSLVALTFLLIAFQPAVSASSQMPELLGMPEMPEIPTEITSAPPKNF